MRVTVWKIRPYFDLDNSFIDIPGQPTFDPKHPRTYPGAEVELVEVMTPDEAMIKYGVEALCHADKILYSKAYGGNVAIWRLTGRTSADVLAEL